MKKTAQFALSCFCFIPHPSSFIPSNNLLRRFEQVFGDEVGAVSPVLALVFELAAPVAREDKGGADSGVARQLRIAVAVADHPAGREVEVELRGRAPDESGPWLAAVAVLPVGRLAHRWM